MSNFAQASLGEGVQVCSYLGPHSFQWEMISKITNIHYLLLNYRANFNKKLGTKQNGMKWIQIYSIEVPCPLPPLGHFQFNLAQSILTKGGFKFVLKIAVPRPFPRGDNNVIMKFHWQNLKIFSWITGPISTTKKLGTKHCWMKGIQVCSNELPCPISRGNNM